MRSITHAADELGVSRKKVYNEIERLNISTSKEGKNNYITDKDFGRIKQKIENENQSALNRVKNVLEHDRSMIGGNLSDREYIDLKERIAFLERQLNIKDGQINGLIQSNFNFSKALLPPVQEQAISVNDTKKVSWIKKIFNL